MFFIPLFFSRFTEFKNVLRIGFICVSGKTSAGVGTSTNFQTAQESVLKKVWLY